MRAGRGPGRRRAPALQRRARVRWESLPPDRVRCNLTDVRRTLTISLPGKTKQLVERAATHSGLTPSEYVRLAIFRKLWQDAAADSRRVALPRARANGVYTDEDVFRLIS